MAFTSGTRLGVYEVTAQIGEGGMGQVYRARDTKLDRDVAIKVLPEAFAQVGFTTSEFTQEDLQELRMGCEFRLRDLSAAIPERKCLKLLVF